MKMLDGNLGRILRVGIVDVRIQEKIRHDIPVSDAEKSQQFAEFVSLHPEKDFNQTEHIDASSVIVHYDQEPDACSAELLLESTENISVEEVITYRKAIKDAVGESTEIKIMVNGQINFRQSSEKPKNSLIFTVFAMKFSFIPF